MMRYFIKPCREGDATQYRIYERDLELGECLFETAEQDVVDRICWLMNRAFESGCMNGRKDALAHPF
jgi:hypothetical protein